MSCPSGFERYHPQRLAALHSYAILDTPPEHPFDEIARMAAAACGTAMARITFVDAERTWTKAAFGHAAQDGPRDTGFCLETLCREGVLIRSDFGDVAGEPGLRFYAGVALVTPNGWAIGTLSVLDRAPHGSLTEPQVFILEGLGRTLMSLLEGRRAALARHRDEALLQSRADRLEAQVAAQTRDRDRVWTLSPVLKIVSNKDGQVQSVNPSWSRALGWSEAETLGRTALDFIAAPDREAARAALEPLCEDRRVEDVELACTTRDGDRRRVLWTVVPEDGLYYGFGRDITEQRQAEEALRQSQKLEAIGQLTGGVAHDFNNLLTIIRSSVEFLRRPELAEERKRRYLDAVSDTVDRAAKLTGQLLAFARRQALKPQVFDICARLRSISDMLDSVTGARIHVETDLPGTPCFVRADESQFETALINMAVNARDAMDGEGSLTLRLESGRPMPPIRGHAGAPGPFVAVMVVDTGTGIPAPDLGRIFEPFFTTKEIGKGTGLGLSQVIGFAKQSGGDIDVASLPGSGTRFTLYLPQVDAPADVADSGRDDRREPEPQRSLCILVVEDNLEVGRFCTQILEDLGHAPIWTKSAEEALAELERTPARFDAVFSDVVMPGMGGVALARQLQITRPDLSVVLTSGYSHVLATDDAHGFALVRKPYSAAQLAQVLYEATQLRGGRGTRPPLSG
ncbi:ATP-binding protein [Methylobacterium sp. J-048]|uniref:ATP-binding protein n=1 Tax=Methylobacterium sp. J-048 TaxID=2836635 RepID=UPI001FB8AD08|nr:ATP-binding protein [Methylobacterium sp. J-048]MCJ2060905.1 ATP-binding protein [Methylobacterium sp. J-048]